MKESVTAAQERVRECSEASCVNCFVHNGCMYYLAIGGSHPASSICAGGDSPVSISSSACHLQC